MRILQQGLKNIKQKHISEQKPECSPIPSRATGIKLIPNLYLTLKRAQPSIGRAVGVGLLFFKQPATQRHHVLSSPLSSAKSVWGMHYRWDTSSLLQTKEDVQQSLIMHTPFTTHLCAYTHLTAPAVSHTNVVISPVNNTWANTQTLQTDTRS